MHTSRIVWTIGKAASRALLRGKLADPRGTFSLSMRVWPNEADLKFVNHASYFVYFEAARWDAGLQCGFGNVLRSRQCSPIAGGQLIQYLRPMQRHDTFEVVTKILAVDERWWHFEHKVVRKGEVCTRAWVKVVMRNRTGVLAPQELLRLAGHTVELPNDVTRVDKLVKELATCGPSATQ